MEGEQLLSSDEDEASADGEVGLNERHPTACAGGDEMDLQNDVRISNDYSKKRRKSMITSIWDRKTIRGQISISTFLKQTTTGYFDDTHSTSLAIEVGNKLPNILILAALSDAASGIRPLLKPLTKIHLEHPRYYSI
jgi:hypothetical protein